eukprot:COSAG06_NODE_656_length_13333_cov_6.485492_10_plen_179_part_00
MRKMDPNSALQLCFPSQAKPSEFPRKLPRSHPDVELDPRESEPAFIACWQAAGSSAMCQDPVFGQKATPAPRWLLTDVVPLLGADLKRVHHVVRQARQEDNAQRNPAARSVRRTKTESRSRPGTLWPAQTATVRGTGSAGTREFTGRVTWCSPTGSCVRGTGTTQRHSHRARCRPAST